MTSWIKSFQDEGKALVESGAVGEVDFSGSTYQVEVLDQETYWPFFQFDEKGKLKDAFCSCDSEQEGCKHLAAGHLKIFSGHKTPLHVRYEASLWKKLCELFAGEYGYDLKVLPTIQEHFFPKGLEAIFVPKEAQTPENSLKFSNLSSEEIDWWKEGRPSASLRFELSFWSDLAKFLVQNQDLPYKVTFNKEGLPLHLHAKWETSEVRFAYTKEQLEQLIPTFETFNSGLKLLKSSSAQIDSVSYNSATQTLHIAHPHTNGKNQVEGEKIGSWIYLPHIGFLQGDGVGLLGQNEIKKENIAAALDEHSEQLASFLDLHTEKKILQWEMQFDTSWNWHFKAYLFAKGDLQKDNSALFGNWAYIEGKGFFALTESLFDATEATVSAEQVSQFVTTHRIWLNAQEGFQTHLASIESQLGYRVDEKGLHFATTSQETAQSHDFGEWIYYANLGFFSKHHVRMDLAVRPGVSIPTISISSFIRKNWEELEGIAGFFSDNMPIEERGLDIGIHSSNAIFVAPCHKPEDAQIYGDFVYTEEMGFCELPPAMRIPDKYQERRIVKGGDLLIFLSTELSKLKRVIHSIDPRLKIPVRFDLEASYLVRSMEGGLKAKLIYHTEQGQISAVEIKQAVEKKQRYLFSDAGLIDLHDERLAWIGRLTTPYYPDSDTMEIPTWEFLRLEATYGIRGPKDGKPSDEITRNLLRELQSFHSAEKPNLAGLKSELRLYQQTGAQWLWFLYRNGLAGLLCDDMGLGKTHQAMALMTSIQNFRKSGTYLVVCPTSVIYHWEDKLATFLPDMEVHTYHGIKRKLKRSSGPHVLLTTFGILRTDIAKLKKITFDLAVFDEIQVAKNAHSRVHSALVQVNAKMALGLTGTPIENNLRELKSLFDIVLPGYMPGEKAFRETFINPIEKDFDEEQKAQLTKMIRPFILRRRKVEVLEELPDKIEDKSYCELSAEQATLYQEILEKNRPELIANIRNQEGVIPYVHIFSLLSQLKQVCDHPALLAKDPQHYGKYESGKWELFVQLLDEAHESEQKVVVFSQYLYMLDIMEHYFKKQGWGYAQIRGDTIDRKGELKRFAEDPKCTIFIGSLQAAGLGIDLTSASVVIMYDRWWNAARENQAIDRVHRIGQKWGVQVYKLITKNTIEEKIDRMIFKKGRLMEEIVTADDQTTLKRFTRSELIELLTFEAEAPE